MEQELRAYVSIFRRRARLIGGVFAVVVAAVLVFTWLQPPKYRASALIEIRGAEAAIPSIDGLFAEGQPREEEIRTYYGLLRSTTLANRVIDSLGLDTSEEFNPEGDALRQDMVAGFLERLVVDPVEESRLVNVTFEAGSPELAADIANTVVDAYSALRVEARKDAARRVAAQADSVEGRLAQSEEALRSFALAHDLPYLVEEDFASQLSTRLGDLRAREAEAEGTRYEAESLYEVAVREGRIDLVEDEILNDLTLRLSELRREHARLSATFTDDYPATAEVQRQVEHVRGLLLEEQARLAGRVESDYRLAMQREEKLATAIGEQEEIANELGPQSGDYHVLRQAVLANRTVYANLLDKQRQAEIAAAIGPTDLAVIDRAAPPTQPHSPVFAINLGLALMLGLVLGVGAAFGKEVMDDTVQTVEDIPASDDVPVLGMIPALEADDPGQLLVQSMRRARGAIPWPEDPRARAAEKVRRYRLATWPRIDEADKRDPTGNALADAFAALRAAVLFKDDGDMRSILVSSCRAGEGKTTVSVNFAMSLATLGKRVLLIDADLRRPAVDRALKVPAGPGLLNCLTDSIAWRQAVQSTGTPGLDVLVAGGTTTRAADFLAGYRVMTLLEAVQAAYDYVIVDAPALFINAADARLLSQLVDGVVVVVRSRSTPRALVDRIPRTIPNVIGIVVNDLRKDSLPGYFAEYFDGYDLPERLPVDGPAWEPPSETRTEA
jgi:capsular exopolysaccharide synthesis family protein